jgi:hypothetical protein
MLEYHLREPKEDLSKWEFCPFCGEHLLKIEQKPQKVCPEGCCSIEFEIETTKT